MGVHLPALPLGTSHESGFPPPLPALASVPPSDPPNPPATDPFAPLPEPPAAAPDPPPVPRPPEPPSVAPATPPEFVLALPPVEVPPLPPVEVPPLTVIVSPKLEPPAPSPSIAPCPAAPPVPMLFSVTVFLVVFAQATSQNCEAKRVWAMTERLSTPVTLAENAGKRQAALHAWAARSMLLAVARPRP